MDKWNRVLKDMALTDNLVAYYKYNQGALLVDSSGNGKTLTNNNSVEEASDGKFGYCADIGSSGTNKSLSSPVNLGTGNFTINFWQKYDSIPGTNILQCLCSVRVNGTKTNHEFDYRNEGGVPKYNLWTGSSGGNEAKYNITESTGVYYMLTLTYDGSKLRLYRNTSLILTLSTGSYKTSDATQIMFGNRVGTARSVDGKQDEAGVWSRELTAGEISQLYNSGVGLTYPFTTFNPHFSRRKLL